MMVKKLIVFLVLIFLIVGCKQPAPVLDADFAQAEKHYAAREYEKAYAPMLRSAEGGNPVSQYRLGWMYLNGAGVEQDVGEALQWFTEAAERGEALAMTKIGTMYLHNVLGAGQCQMAVEWLERAAEADDLDAQKILALLYIKGKCVQKDIRKGNALYSKVFKNKKASNATKGEMLFWGLGVGGWGLGVEQDCKRAVVLLESAFNDNKSGAGYNLGVAYSKGLGVQKDLKKSYYYYQSALSGNADSQYNVGLYLYNGYGVSVDKEAAILWIMKSANKNHAMALTFIGYMYEIGGGVEKKIDIAKEYYKRASALGDKRAARQLKNLQK